MPKYGERAITLLFIRTHDSYDGLCQESAISHVVWIESLNRITYYQVDSGNSKEKN